MQINTGCSWSGGKDSCYALMKAKQLGYDPKILVNMMNENGEISRSHGLPFAILQQQAAMMDLPIIAQPTTWQAPASPPTTAAAWAGSSVPVAK